MKHTTSMAEPMSLEDLLLPLDGRVGHPAARTSSFSSTTATYMQPPATRALHGPDRRRVLQLPSVTVDEAAALEDLLLPTVGRLDLPQTGHPAGYAAQARLAA